MLKNRLSNFGLYFDKAADSGGGQASANADAKKDETGNAPEAGNSKSGQIIFESDEALQKEFEKRLKERLAREEKKRDDAAKKAKEEAEGKALEEQKEFQKLSEKQKGQIADLTQRVSELEPATERVKTLEAALTKFRDAQVGEVPEHLKPLLEKLDVVEQIEWLTVNREKLKTTPNGVPATPNPADPKDLDEATKKVASEQAARYYAGRF